ncbi:hypothetical protein P167DRAFT_537891 [Morchella conica CCBAS932]|uniref:Uncharacterized protein n=1 Tax=Morchella conica CCBAS932 TaxID=1392247 RepID=A0A3N4KLE0_9PEZI|nr:hypothetical protein P167DRAFT_537891 [Morchella conica CCBAS932]
MKLRYLVRVAEDIPLPLGTRLSVTLRYVAPSSAGVNAALSHTRYGRNLVLGLTSVSKKINVPILLDNDGSPLEDHRNNDIDNSSPKYRS